MNTGLTALTVLTLAIDPVMPAILYAGTIYGGAFKSENGGGNWIEVNTGLPDTHIYALAIDPMMPTILYAGTFDGAFKTTNGGGSWSGASNGLPSVTVLALAIDPEVPATLYTGTRGGGVFRSTDGAESWGAVNAGLLHANLGAHALALTIQCSIEGIGVDPSNPPWAWEYWDKEHEKWLSLRLETDTTGGFNTSGQIILHIPVTGGKRELDNRSAFWIRCRATIPLPG